MRTIVYCPVRRRALSGYGCSLQLLLLLALALHLPRGGAAEGRAARRWRAPFRSTSLRAEEPAANDAAGPKNGQAGKVVPGGHWAASGAPISATNPRARTPWWLGGSLPNLATDGAIFARNRVPARNADHT